MNGHLLKHLSALVGVGVVAVTLIASAAIAHHQIARNSADIESASNAANARLDALDNRQRTQRDILIEIRTDVRHLRSGMERRQPAAQPPGG